MPSDKEKPDKSSADKPSTKKIVSDKKETSSIKTSEETESSKETVNDAPEETVNKTTASSEKASANFKAKAKKRRPLSITAKRWIKVGVVGIIAAAIIIPISIFTAPKQADETSEVLPSKTEADREQIASITVESLAQYVGANVTEQIGEDNVSGITVNQSNLNEDTEGKKAKVAVITFANISSNLDPQKNIDTVTDYLGRINDEAGANWYFAQASENELGEGGPLTALKAWDKSKTPQNPAIIEIAYYKNLNEDGTTFTYEIVISVSVY